MAKKRGELKDGNRRGCCSESGAWRRSGSGRHAVRSENESKAQSASGPCPIRYTRCVGEAPRPLPIRPGVLRRAAGRRLAVRRSIVASPTNGGIAAPAPGRHELQPARRPARSRILWRCLISRFAGSAFAPVSGHANERGRSSTSEDGNSSALNSRESDRTGQGGERSGPCPVRYTVCGGPRRCVGMSRLSRATTSGRRAVRRGSTVSPRPPGGRSALFHHPSCPEECLLGIGAVEEPRSKGSRVDPDLSGSAVCRQPGGG